jgi:vacuolar-type H+-ATPase subunit H
MAGDLLHLIRDAERKAEEIIQEATTESKLVISHAKESAKQLLQESEATKKDFNENLQSVIQDQIADQKGRLMSDFHQKESDLKEKAANKKQDAIETVLKMILES